MDNLRRLGDRISIRITSDKDGFTGRECPQPDCKGYFKIEFGTGLKGESLSCHCPYCGHAAGHDHFWTKQMVKAGVVILAVGLVLCAASLWLPPPWCMPAGFLGAFSVLVAGWTALAGVILRVVWAAKQRRIAELEDPFDVRR